MTIQSLSAEYARKMAAHHPYADSIHATEPLPQLPVHSYFDEDLFVRERQKIFDLGPIYLGHVLHLPEPNDYRVVDDDQGRILVNDAGHIRLLSNVCKHRQARMLSGHGNTPQIVCPLHRWTYALSGELIGAPHFDPAPCAHLGQDIPLQNWQGLLFSPHQNPSRDVPNELSAIGCADLLNFSGYRWNSKQIHSCPYNWKTFIEVYLEDYHVEPFHLGLCGFVSCEQLVWQFTPHFSVQQLGIKNGLNTARSPIYQAWQAEVCRYFGPNIPINGAVWLLIYPNVMVEFYPGTLVISTLTPKGTGLTINQVDFFYTEEIALFEPSFVAAQQAAYNETMREDDEIGERMDQGRLALLLRGTSEVGPYQQSMESGMEQFHHWYRQKMFASRSD